MWWETRSMNLIVVYVLNCTSLLFLERVPIWLLFTASTRRLGTSTETVVWRKSVYKSWELEKSCLLGVSDKTQKKISLWVCLPSRFQDTGSLQTELPLLLSTIYTYFFVWRQFDCTFFPVDPSWNGPSRSKTRNWNLVTLRVLRKSVNCQIFQVKPSLIF